MSEEQTSPSVPTSPPVDLMLAAEVSELLGSGAASVTSGSVLAWRIAPGDVRGMAQRLRDAGWDYLLFVTALDYPDEHRFEVDYLLARYADGRHIALVTDIPRDTAEIDTVSDIWAAADWHEREVYDLFGIRFLGHPFLRRILLDQDWVGHPLRKDYVDTLHDVVKRPY